VSHFEITTPDRSNKRHKLMKTWNSNIGGRAFKASLALVALIGATQITKADFITYSPKGTPNTDPGTFTASASGDVWAYFTGADAGYYDRLGMMVNGVLTSAGYGLVNNPTGTTPFGFAFNLGNVSVGNLITFVLQVSPNNNPAQTYYVNSNAGHSIFSTAFAGNATIPAGTYVGFEDLIAGNDYDYNDHTFVFNIQPPLTGNSITAIVPEPTTILAGALLLLPLGVSTIRILRNRKM